MNDVSGAIAQLRVRRHAAPSAHARGPVARASIEALLDAAQSFVRAPGERVPPSDSAAGVTVANLFTEPSTRTRVSFELAAKRLGAQVVNLEVQLSSRVKGESMLDTVYTLEALHADVLVIREAEAGVLELVASHVAPHVSVLSAGEAHLAHPTQGLLDALTVRQKKQALRQSRALPSSATCAIRAWRARPIRRSAPSACRSCASLRRRPSCRRRDEFAGAARFGTLKTGLEGCGRRHDAAHSEGAHDAGGAARRRSLLREVWLDPRAPRARQARRHRHASAADESRHRDRIRRRRRAAVGDPRSGAKRRRRAHGGARGGRAAAHRARAREPRAARHASSSRKAACSSRRHSTPRQFVIRIEAPQCAAHATPGSFAHVTCDPKIPMRRPLSLMRADTARRQRGDPLQGRRRRLAGLEPRAPRRARLAPRSHRTWLHARIPTARRALLLSAAASASRRSCSSPSICRRARMLHGSRSPSSAPRSPFRFRSAARARHLRASRRCQLLHAAARGLGHRKSPRKPRGI